MNARSEADVRSLAILFGVGTSCGLSDVELLERFLDSSDQAAEGAFEGLVVRHGPMVLDVCRKILGDAHDAQDAFQATFLILATRAKSIRKQRSIGSWLHGVALRVARRARSDTARRKTQERRIAEMTSRDVEAGPPREPDDFRVLHEEVARLPRKYREPIVFCYLEGMPLEAVAGRLGCPIGTVGVRLMRARERLKARLGRRGGSAPDGLVVAGLSSRRLGDLAGCPGSIHGGRSGSIHVRRVGYAGRRQARGRSLEEHDHGPTGQDIRGDLGGGNWGHFLRRVARPFGDPTSERAGQRTGHGNGDGPRKRGRSWPRKRGRS
jgi:RNA polymerase sigma factor (sigma-70 family)